MIQYSTSLSLIRETQIVVGIYRPSQHARVPILQCTCWYLTVDDVITSKGVYLKYGAKFDLFIAGETILNCLPASPSAKYTLVTSVTM
jgi:hypothetical protein